jgi:hypothetical protein
VRTSGTRRIRAVPFYHSLRHAFTPCYGSATSVRMQS